MTIPPVKKKQIFAAGRETGQGVDKTDSRAHVMGVDVYKRQQDNRFAEYMEKAASIYDYCIIDNPPAILMCTINALCAADEVIIPVRLDNWSIDGVEVITEQIETCLLYTSRCV